MQIFGNGSVLPGNGVPGLGAASTTDLRLARPLAYLLGIALTLAILLIHLALRFAGGDRPLLILFVFPILVAAYMGGIGPGLLSTATAAAAVKFVLFPALAARHDARPVDNVLWFALIVCGAVIGLLSENLHRSRKRAVASERHYRDLFEGMLEGYAYSRMIYEDSRPVDFVYLHVNEAFERLTGLKDVVGRKVSEVIPGVRQSNPELLEIYGRVAASGHPEGFETFVKPLGIWFSISVYCPEKGCFVAVFQNITARKRAEEALRDSEVRYRRIVDTTNEGIWSVDQKLRTTFVNEAFARMLGYTLGEMLGTPARQFIFEEDLEEFREHMNARRQNFSEQYERRFRKKDGSECWCLVSGTPVLDAEGQYAGSFGMFTDITGRRQLEEQLRQSQKMEAIGQLAGGVAHDFNNLLTVISGNAEVLLGRMAPDSPLRTGVADILHSGERAAALTRQLLAFSRKQILEPKILDLNDVVSGTEKMLRRLIGEDIILSCALAPDLHRVKVDPGQMEQVIFNIAVNARDAMPKGGRLTIETRNVEEAGARSVLLAMRDTGCGMTPEIASRIFEPFFTTKGPGKGTGLGLATVWGIVRQSGGQIEVRSAPGAGTTIEILLPACEEAAAARVRSDARLPAVPHGTETVLLVEDEEAVRRIVKLVLEASGYTLLEAKDGREALKIAASHDGPLHLVVTDLVMPGMSGRELAEHLRGETPSLRLLFISGYTDDAVMRHGVTDEGEAFLQKPFTPLLLAKKVREVLDAKR